MAKRGRKKKKKEVKETFRYKTELNGLLLVLIFGMGIPSFGIIGEYINKFSVFLMGKFNIVFLALMVILGAYMIFKGELPKFFSAKKIGIYILILVVLTFSHLNLINNFEIKDNKIISTTLDHFKDAISSSESNISVGGGMIGALTSRSLIYLLSVEGTKIALIIIAVVGSIMLFEINFGSMFEKIREYFKNRPEKVKKERVNIQDNDEVKIHTMDNPISKKVMDQTPPKHEEQLVMATVDSSGKYILPSLDLFDAPKPNTKTNSTEFLKNNKNIIERVLNDFQLYGKVVNIHEGPAVTQYEVDVKSGTKLSRITNINRELALALAAKDVRIMAPIPGKSTVGIEIPNRVISSVPIREVFANFPKQTDNASIIVALGKDLMGNVMSADLTKMPHLLVAGSTGSGKSVCINSFIASILMRYTDEQVKLVLVDPKKVELSNYKEIPHLLYPVVTDPKQANFVLKKIVEEMEKRYDQFSEKECKNITSYNDLIEKELRRNPDAKVKKMPYIVTIIDEFADLMLIAAKEVEDSIMRITQMARAAGIHLIVATQRPSTDVITGIVKANIASRIAFAVSSGIDSRTILDMQGAEKLLGKGDMLYLPMGENSPVRIQGAYISDDETKRLIDFVTNNRKAHFDETTMALAESKSNYSGNDAEEEPMYDEIVEFAIATGKISASLLQRKFRFGFNRAARVVDLLEERGIVGPPNGSKPRDVLIKKDEE